MSRYQRLGAAVVFLVGASAAGGAQELTLSSLQHRLAADAPPAVGADCAGGEIYDDGAAEDGYSGEPKVVSDFQAVQRFSPAAFPATYDTVCVGLVSPGGSVLDLEIEIFDDDGAQGGPGTRLGSLAFTATGIPNGLPCAFYRFDISDISPIVDNGHIWVGVRWNASEFPTQFVCADTSETTALQPGFVNFNLGAGWEATETIFEDHRAQLLRAVPRVINTGVFSPHDLEADYAPLTSNGNGVFEPGEQVNVAPAWENGGADSPMLVGNAFAFSGPAGHGYEVDHDTANYAPIPAGDNESCRDGGTCYQMSVDPGGVARPAPHWDASFYETLLTDDSTHIWTLHLGDSFDDVPQGNLFYPFVETLLHRGVTSGCVGAEYCPAAKVTRAQMSVFVLKALLGAIYTPSGCSEVFNDVPCSSPFARWIEDFASRNITDGCGDDVFCPGAGVTRAQMAVFMLRGLKGPDYTPPACTGVFDDVNCPSLFADWIEDLAAREITGGCDSSNYCPNAPVARGQMAAFLTQTFGLTLYGP